MVDIYFPAVEETYSLKLDDSVQIKYLLQEIGEMISKKYKCSFDLKDNQLALCSVKDKKVLPNNTTLIMNGITNGEKLLVI